MLIVSRPQQGLESLGVPLAYDLVPDGGALGGIYTALEVAQGPVFCCACDMPFLNDSLIRSMADNFTNLDVLLPKLDGRLHPLHAFYSLDCITPIRAALDSGERKIISFFPQVRVAYFTEDRGPDVEAMRLALFNINTQSELVWAQKTIAETILHRKN